MIRAASETQTLMVVVQIRTLDARDSDSPPGTKATFCLLCLSLYFLTVMYIGEMRAAIVKMLIDQLIYNNNCEKKRTYDGYTIASLFLQEVSMQWRFFSRVSNNSGLSTLKYCDG